MKKIELLVLTCLLSIFSTLAIAETSYRLYMDPDGERNYTIPGSGESVGFPLKTLGNVQEKISNYLDNNPDIDIEVRIAEGEYIGSDHRVDWTVTMPNNKITFMPQTTTQSAPIFKGNANGNETCIPRGWFFYQNKSNVKTNLHFRYLRIENYESAILLGGNYNKSHSNGNNSIYGMYFQNIGNVRCGDNTYSPTSAVSLTNSDSNNISNNHFINIINYNTSVADPGNMHAIYLSNNSSNNIVRSNRFEANSGDAIRVRNYSNNNTIYNNRMYNTGQDAAYSEWFDISDESPSWDNSFTNNIFDVSYTGASLQTVKLIKEPYSTEGMPSIGSKRVCTDEDGGKCYPEQVPY